MSNSRRFDTEAVYQIRIVGRLDQSWSDWFDGFTITFQDNESWLVGPVADQAALLGILVKIGRLNLPLLSVNRLEDQADELEQAKIQEWRKNGYTHR